MRAAAALILFALAVASVLSGDDLAARFQVASPALQQHLPRLQTLGEELDRLTLEGCRKLYAAELAPTCGAMLAVELAEGLAAAFGADRL